MSLAEAIRQFTDQVNLLERVARLNQPILEKLMRQSPPPTDLAQVRNFLRSAADLMRQGDDTSASQLLEQARSSLRSVRQWLAVGDLAITPYVLRKHLDRDALTHDALLALIRYFLEKDPHAHNDRDKLDYLLTLYFATEVDGQTVCRFHSQPELLDELSRLVPGPHPELTTPTEIMLHELESLSAGMEEFASLDKLMDARLVERARTLKVNLGDNFFHPAVLSHVIQFNIHFRRQFEKLFEAELRLVSSATRARIAEAWDMVRAIEETYEDMALPGQEPVQPEPEPAHAIGGDAADRLELSHERVPLDRLHTSGEEAQKEHELRGIMGRMTRFVEKLSPQEACAEKVLFPLRNTTLELVRWEREVFRTKGRDAPHSIRTVQLTLGLVAWLKEELALYQQMRGDRYLWKPHFDFLAYGVRRTLEVLKSARELLRDDAPDKEVVWFRPMLQSVLRLANTLNRVAPVFADPHLDRRAG